MLTPPTYKEKLKTMGNARENTEKIELLDGRYIEVYCAWDTHGSSVRHHYLKSKNGTTLKCFFGTHNYPHKPQELKDLLKLRKHKTNYQKFLDIKER